MKIIVGLGNPGTKYETTRHNVGFMLIDHLADEWRAQGPIKKFNAEVFTGDLPGAGPFLLVKPQTFMNLSGQTVAGIVNFYKTNPTELLVIHDDLDLPSMSMRFKVGGGPGGHNGLKSIDESLGSGNNGYHRLRLGIGKPERGDPADYVLKPFSESEAKALGDVLETGIQAVKSWACDGIAKTMNEFNKREVKEE